MSTIEKKIWPEFFEKVLSGEKTYELRLADWDCAPGDTLLLKEWEPDQAVKKVDRVPRLVPRFFG